MNPLHAWTRKHRFHQTKDGRRVPWCDVDTRHLWNILRYYMKRLREKRKILKRDIYKETERDLRNINFIIIDELEYREALPTISQLEIIWDKFISEGGTNPPFTLIEFWIQYGGEHFMLSCEKANKRKGLWKSKIGNGN